MKKLRKDLSFMKVPVKGWVRCKKSPIGWKFTTTGMNYFLVVVGSKIQIFRLTRTGKVQPVSRMYGRTYSVGKMEVRTERPLTYAKALEMFGEPER